MAKSVVWKRSIQFTNRQKVKLRSPGRIVHFGKDPQGRFCVWFIADPLADLTLEKELVIVGTGHEFDPAGMTHVGTIVDGAYVCHLFEIV